MPPKKKNQRTDAHQKGGGESPNDINAYPAQSSVPRTMTRASTSEVTRRALTLEGWDITQVPDSMRRCRVSTPRFVPSHFAFESSEETMSVISTLHGGVRLLFENLQIYWEHPADDMLSGNPISDNGRNGKFCAFGDTEDEPAVYGWQSPSKVRLRISMFVAPS